MNREQQLQQNSPNKDVELEKQLALLVELATTQTNSHKTQKDEQVTFDDLCEYFGNEPVDDDS